VCPHPLSLPHRAKKLHEDRHTEMQQTLSQMNDRTEELERVLEQKDAAGKAKQQAEDKLEVSGIGFLAHLLVFSGQERVLSRRSPLDAEGPPFVLPCGQHCLSTRWVH
jgi:hypothetical protein